MSKANERLVMWRADTAAGRAVMVECPNGLWPANDADGVPIFENTHFTTQEDAFLKVQADASARIELAARSVSKAEHALQEALREAGEAAKHWSAVMRHSNDQKAI